MFAFVVGCHGVKLAHTPINRPWQNGLWSFEMCSLLFWGHPTYNFASLTHEISLDRATTAHSGVTSLYLTR